MVRKSTTAQYMGRRSGSNLFIFLSLKIWKNDEVNLLIKKNFCLETFWGLVFTLSISLTFSPACTLTQSCSLSLSLSLSHTHSHACSSSSSFPSLHVEYQIEESLDSKMWNKKNFSCWIKKNPRLKLRLWRLASQRSKQKAKQNKAAAETQATRNWERN